MKTCRKREFTLLKLYTQVHLPPFLVKFGLYICNQFMNFYAIWYKKMYFETSVEKFY